MLNQERYANAKHADPIRLLSGAVQSGSKLFVKKLLLLGKQRDMCSIEMEETCQKIQKEMLILETCL